VTSDSLAGESLHHGGAFDANNPHAAASSQPSKGTTSNNTDTSGARVLPPAPDRAHRPDGPSDATQMLNHDKHHPGVGPTYTTPGDERRAALRSGESGHHGEYDTQHGGGARHAGTAPTYVSAGHPPPETQKPKGKNLHEGGFDPNLPNASFNGQIGTRKDPGRMAELQFEKENAVAPGDAGHVKDRGGLEKGQFGALKDESD